MSPHDGHSVSYDREIDLRQVRICLLRVRQTIPYLKDFAQADGSLPHFGEKTPPWIEQPTANLLSLAIQACIPQRCKKLVLCFHFTGQEQCLVIVREHIVYIAANRCKRAEANKGFPRVNCLQFLDRLEHGLNLSIVPIPEPVAFLDQGVESVTDFCSKGLRDNNHGLMRVPEFSCLDLSIAGR